MYGANMSSGIAGGSLAATGMAAGSMILLVVGAVFIAAGFYMLLKKNSVHRP